MKLKTVSPIVLFLSIALVEFIIINFSFYPGFIWPSPDSKMQLLQAKGELPYNDWHPPILAYFWSLLMKLSHRESGLFVFQTGLVCFSSFLFALAAHRDQNIKSSFTPVVVQLVPLMPFVICILCWTWKDNFMTWLAVTGIAIIYLCSTFSSKIIQFGACLLAILLWATATCFRANGILYLVFLLSLPVFVLCSRRKNSVKKNGIKNIYEIRRVIGIALTVLLVYVMLFLGIRSFVNYQTDVRATHQIDQLFLDDTLALNSADDISKLPVTDQFKKMLLETKANCESKPKQNMLWSCVPLTPTAEEKEYGTAVFKPIATYHQEYFPAWKHTLLNHPVNYIAYRFDMFTRFLFETRSYSWPTTSDQPENSGYNVKFPYARSAMTRYYTGSFTGFPFLTKGFFWLAVSSFILFLTWKKYRDNPRIIFNHRTDLVIFIMSLTSLLSILSLFPIVPAPEYRYCYFSVILTAITMILKMDKIAAKYFKSPNNQQK